MRMVTATVIAVSVLGVCAAWCCGRDAGWCCGRDAGWKQAADAYAARNGNYERLVWAMANQAKDLEEFKERYRKVLLLDEGEADDGVGI